MRNRAPGALGPRLALGLVTAALAAGSVLPAVASPLEYLPVGDPLEAELRTLDLLDPGPLGSRILLPRLHTRPLQRFEFQGEGAPPAVPAIYGISLTRLERAFQRDAVAGFAPRPGLASTPRLIAADGGDGARLEVSAGLEGGGSVDEHEARYADGSGMRLRMSAGVERWLAFTNLLVGYVDQARTFADPILQHSDFIAYTDETYLAYAAPAWGLQFGRNRWHWGPGEESSLTLAKTAPAITGFEFHGRLRALRLDATALSATLGASAGEQLAAHRVEWQPFSSLRAGITEMARYHSASWQALYVVGVIPYVLVQRLQAQDEPDSNEALRNNVLMAFDAAWRVAPGTRAYGELLIDDFNTRTTDVPDKLGFQLGLEGVGTAFGSRVTWGTEYTRLSRFVYTSFFGRSYEAQGEPLGYFTGPDSRRVRVRGAWDLSAVWQVRAAAALTDRGESGLDRPFVPGSPHEDTFVFLGVVERTREFELGLRWWPASGVDLAVSGGYRWIENQAHAEGVDDGTPYGTLALRVTR
jgi:capsule assembly protein Wzi